MHATLKLNEFHSPAFAGQPDIQFQKLHDYIHKKVSTT